MKIAIGADHAGVDLKDRLAEFLQKLGAEVTDVGTRGPESVDYPDFAREVARRVADGRAERGVLVCGTGVGMSITANKVQGVRAAVVSEEYSAVMSRRHNDANVLCLGGRVVGTGLAESIVKAWLDAPFEGGRHEKRVDKIRQLDDARGGERR